MITQVISGLFFGLYFINVASLLSSSIYNSINITNGEVDDTSLQFERIINGYPAPVGKFQFQVALYILYTPRMMTMCGGVIVSEYHVLTAAHCVQDLSNNSRKIVHASSIIVLAGSLDLKSNETRMLQVKEVIEHERYRRLDYDIAVLKLVLKLPTNIIGFKVIKLIKKSVPIGTKCVLSGWGRRGLNDMSKPKHLSYTFNYVIRRKRCEKLVEEGTNLTVKGFLTPRMICVSYKKKPSSGCSGDSGGPLICKRRLAGILSFGPKKCSELQCKYPCSLTIFSNVYNLRSWIISKIKLK